VRALCAAFPARSPLLPALTRSLRAASAFPTSLPQQDKRARSGTQRLYYTSKQTGGETNPETHWGRTRNPPRPRKITARFQVLPQTPIPASPKRQRRTPPYPATVEMASIASTRNARRIGNRGKGQASRVPPLPATAGGLGKGERGAVPVVPAVMMAKVAKERGPVSPWRAVPRDTDSVSRGTVQGTANWPRKVQGFPVWIYRRSRASPVRFPLRLQTRRGGALSGERAPPIGTGPPQVGGQTLTIASPSQRTCATRPG
jgi:hypothetical protein